MEELLQRAVLVGVNLGNEDDFAYSMEELTNLAEACDVEVNWTSDAKFTTCKSIPLYWKRKD